MSPPTPPALVLPPIVAPFLKAYPDIRLEVVGGGQLRRCARGGCDAGIRYDERLEQDMIAVPIGPRVQRFATAAAPGYLDARRPPGAPARPARASLPSRPSSPAAPSRLGVRTRRRDRAHRPNRAARDTARLGRRSCSSTQRSLGWASSACSRTGSARPWTGRAQPGAGALVAELLRTVSLLSEPPAPAGAAARLCRLHQEIDGAAIWSISASPRPSIIRKGAIGFTSLWALIACRKRDDAAHGPIITGAPTATRSKRSMTSSLYIRMQP